MPSLKYVLGGDILNAVHRVRIFYRYERLGKHCTAKIWRVLRCVTGMGLLKRVCNWYGAAEESL